MGLSETRSVAQSKNLHCGNFCLNMFKNSRLKFIGPFLSYMRRKWPPHCLQLKPEKEAPSANVSQLRHCTGLAGLAKQQVACETARPLWKFLEVWNVPDHCWQEQERIDGQ